MSAPETPLRTDYYGYTVACGTCGRIKKPFGRSAPVGVYMCEYGCPGYDREPLPSHLWPNESEADFGYRVPR